MYQQVDLISTILCVETEFAAGPRPEEDADTELNVANIV